MKLRPLLPIKGRFTLTLRIAGCDTLLRFFEVGANRGCPSTRFRGQPLGGAAGACLDNDYFDGNPIQRVDKARIS